MEALTSPLLTIPAHYDTDAAITGPKLATITAFARRRRARSIVIGSGRTTNAVASARQAGDHTMSRGRSPLDIDGCADSGST